MRRVWIQIVQVLEEGAQGNLIPTYTVYCIYKCI